jgi:hypothetical protein
MVVFICYLNCSQNFSNQYENEMILNTPRLSFNMEGFCATLFNTKFQTVLVYTLKS